MTVPSPQDVDAGGLQGVTQCIQDEAGVLVVAGVAHDKQYRMPERARDDLQCACPDRQAVIDRDAMAWGCHFHGHARWGGCRTEDTSLPAARGYSLVDHRGDRDTAN